MRYHINTLEELSQCNYCNKSFMDFGDNKFTVFQNPYMGYNVRVQNDRTEEDFIVFFDSWEGVMSFVHTRFVETWDKPESPKQEVNNNYSPDLMKNGYYSWLGIDTDEVQ